MEDKNLIEGFNSGYFLAKEKPELLQALLKGVTGNSEYLEGIKAGQKEYQLEQYQQRMEEHSQQKNQEKENSLDKGR